MSLAEELLNDLEDLDDDDIESGTLDVITEDQTPGPSMNVDGVEGLDEDGEVDEDSVYSVASLYRSEVFTSLLRTMRSYKEDTGTTVASDQRLQKFIVKANNTTVDIVTEMETANKWVRDVYSSAFPELESLVTNVVEYARVVKLIGNQRKELEKVDLTSVITPAVSMVVHIMASSTKGQELPKEKFEKVEEACDLIIDLDRARGEVQDFVASKMYVVAPNVSHVVGSACAAQLLGAAGGLEVMSKMPANQIALLGAVKKHSTGFSAATMEQHTGFVFKSEFCQSQAPEIRKQVNRLMSSKVTLAARVDAFGASPDGSKGTELREEMETKIEKLLEDPELKEEKALPVPDFIVKKKRGGRRARKKKEREKLTEMYKAANRVSFGVIQDDLDQNNIGFSLNSLSSGSHGARLRLSKGNKKSKVTMSKKLREELLKKNALASSSGAVSGTSSIAFTPVDGLEIINPNAATTKEEASDKYFGSGTASTLSQSFVGFGGAPAAKKAQAKR